MLVLLVGMRYYTMATTRGCGFNPINQVFKQKECWCCGEIPITNDFVMLNCINQTVSYFGFTCNDCEKLCNQEIITQLK